MTCRVFIVVTAALSAACIDGAFVCTSDGQCAGGRCEYSGFCSAADPTCPSGQRYSHDSAGLSGKCVVLPPDLALAPDQSVVVQPDLSAVVDQSVAVPPDLTVVSTDMCVASAFDPNNCGTCGNVCAAGQYCASGACACPPAAPDFCAEDLGTFCTNKLTDIDNCGACGHTCASGSFCQNGACTPACSLTACGAACVDTTTDANHCGDCNTVCALGQSCVNSQCTCPSATPDACGSGESALCTSLDTDPLHCGHCNTSCPGGESCVTGVCGVYLLCGATVTNVNTDNSNCGACGAICAGGTDCVAGVCDTFSTCDGTLTNVDTDPYNCGSCGSVGGNVCDTVAGQTCTTTMSGSVCGLSGTNWLVPDTDVRLCYDDGTTGVIACPSAGQAYYGQDAQNGWDTLNPESAHYTIAANNGEPTVTDNITNLIWQGCPAGLSGSSCATGSFSRLTLYDAVSFCNTLSWGGLTNGWRVPDRYELMTIVDVGTHNPAIDTTAFPGTPSYYFLSSSTMLQYGNLWLIDFTDGNVTQNQKGYNYGTRCVH